MFELCTSCTERNCSVALRLVGILGPRGECSVWKVSKWGNGLPCVERYQIFPIVGKISNGYVVDAFG